MTLDGKTVNSIPPEETSHTFVVPELGVFVPLRRRARRSEEPVRIRAVRRRRDHRTITFSFRTGKKGRYHWQCFVPCAAGFIDGLGGPMQTVGYMDGFLNVV